MDFLLDPNIAYLLIVAGLLLALFAIITPGTGMFEIGAIFILLIVGYQVYHLEVNIWAAILLAVGLIPFIFAVRGKKETLNLILTAVAFVVGSAFLFRSDEWWQPAVNPILTIVVSLSAGGIFWIMTTKVLEARAKEPAHDLSGLIGAVGEARTDIHLEGSVYLKGENWTAFSDKPIKAGKQVKVLTREGLMLHVEELK
jgi:membrane-bound serine protease (ClpP class)